MGYRKEDIPGMIAALEVARGNLDRYEFICVALDIGKDPYAYLVEDMIGQALWPFNTLDNWISGREHHHMGIAIRYEWIDKMIADLKEYAK